MIDIHSHILPGIDDGARSWEEAIAMCQIAWNDGIQVIVATPHMFNGVYNNTSELISELIIELQTRLQDEGNPLKAILGAEIYSCPNLSEMLNHQPSLTLNGNGRYFLLEFPHSILPPGSDNYIFQLILNQFIPVIVHPERNLYIQQNPNALKKLVDRGALCQITAMSLTGGFGERASNCAQELLKNDCVHVIASDAHNIKGRPPILSEALKKLINMVGVEKAEEMCELMPRKVLGEFND